MELRPFVALVPHPYQCFLNDILRFCRVERDTKSQPIEFVFQGQYIVPKTDFFHLSVIMTGECLKSYTHPPFFLKYFFRLILSLYNCAGYAVDSRGQSDNDFAYSGMDGLK